MLAESLEAEDLQAPVSPRFRRAQQPHLFSIASLFLGCGSMCLAWVVTIIAEDVIGKCAETGHGYE